MKNKGLVCFFSVLILLSVGGVAFAGALETFTGEKGEVRVAGGTAHITVMKEAATRIMKHNPDIHISVGGGGSGAGIKQVGEGLIDIGNSGRKAKEDEISRYGLQMFKWAIDGVAIVVNPVNKVRSLSQEQVAAIYAGTITSWQEVGGEDRKINIYTRDEASGTRAVFWKKALAKGSVAKNANFVVSNGAMKAVVSQDPYAIGYVSIGHMNETLAGVAFNTIEPTLANVQSGKYPIARGLYSNTKGEPVGLVKKVIDYLFTDEGQEIVAQKGFIPVR
ncbi:MAG: phosphate ABC transporter substrate-binding protein [Thermodesulfobacteriota bacterium]|nr:phosphate ABC transporter substrate-binding protein [Thermodesulfobacteriota bacterium]